MAKTVTKIVAGVKEMFFSESNDNLRTACADSLASVLDNCFINKRIARGTDRAKDLVFHPLFDELQNPNERIRQSACQVLKILN